MLSLRTLDRTRTLPARSSTRAAAALALAALAALPLGCASRGKASADNSAATTAAKTTDGKVAGSAFPVVHDDWAALGYRLDWVGFPFPGLDAKARVLDIDANAENVALQASNSVVTVLEASSGRNRWSFDLATPLTKFVGISRHPSSADMLLVSSQSELFTVAIPNGNLVSRERFDRVVNTRPVIAGQLAIYGTSTGHVLAHIIGRNLPAWGFFTPGAIEADPVVVGDSIAVVSQSGDILFLTSNGGLVGRARIFSGLSNNPVAENGILFIAGRDQSVWAFSATGENLWRHRTSVQLTDQPAAVGGALYVSIPGSGLTAFDGPTGNVRWTAKVGGTVIGTQKGNLLVRTADGLAVVAPATGDVLQQVMTPGVVRVSTDQFADGNLYAVSDRAILAKFTPR